jgi:SHS2 domain-containing protein
MAVVSPKTICSCRPFGTTADMGLSVTAPTLEGLYACAGEGFYSSVCDRRTVRPLMRREVEAAAESLDFLMVAWLNELIYIFDADRFLARRCRVKIKDGPALAAVLDGETFDPARHRFKNIFKAATYHRLSLSRKGGRWRATVVLDV